MESGAKGQADLALMVSFIRWLFSGEGLKEEYAAALADLKARGLVRQTHVGRPMPSEHGLPLWNHARRVIATETLLSPGSLRRPCFVVMDASMRATAFRDWDQAVRFARWEMETHPGAFGPISLPEDLVEVWDRALVSQEEAARLEKDGAVALALPEPVDSVPVLG